ncbi:MAG: peptidylprolyl isomerase [Bdellovibrionales bacterium]
MKNYLNRNKQLRRFLHPVVIAGFFAFSSGCNEKQPIEEIAIVKIGSNQLLAKDFAKKLTEKLKNHDLLSARDPAIVKQAKDSILQEYLHQYIISSWAKEIGLAVSKDELQSEFAKIRANYPDDISFRKAFAEEGVKMEDWLKKLKVKLLERKVLEKIVEDLEKPKLEEAKKFYTNNKSKYHKKQAVKIRQIVTENLVEANRIRKFLRRGKNFEELAKKYSISPDAANGGNIGWVQKGTMDVFDKVMELRTGSTSRVLESSYGHHIIQVIGKNSARHTPFKTVKDQIIKELFEDRKQAAYTSWIDKQAKSLRVFVNDEALSKLKIEVNIR